MSLTALDIPCKSRGNFIACSLKCVATTVSGNIGGVPCGWVLSTIVKCKLEARGIICGGVVFLSGEP